MREVSSLQSRAKCIPQVADYGGVGFPGRLHPCDDLFQFAVIEPQSVAQRTHIGNDGIGGAQEALIHCLVTLGALQSRLFRFRLRLRKHVAFGAAHLRGDEPHLTAIKP